MKYHGLGNSTVDLGNEICKILEKKYISYDELEILKTVWNLNVDESYSLEKENDKNYEVYYVYDLEGNIIESVYIEL